AKLNSLGLFLTFANDDDRNVLANRRVRHDARQILHFLDVLAVELDDHIAGFDAGGLGRPFFLNTGNEGTFSRLDVEAVGNLISDLLNAHTQPATARFAQP